ncbi:MAG: hypothetical protein D3909_09900, partial [Candidatus Electrothrix sp. ATG1]|nr:hypothetical protein [Candidatus Electrothrix sp. ATG1]
MISARKHMRATVFFGLLALVAGGLLFQNMPNNAVAQEDAAHGEHAAEQEAPAEAAATTSDAGVECYESRKDATKLLQVQNANPKYGYPNVKCSPTTGAVLWYGDPYTETEPLGEMPKYDDETDGDFAQAVIR